MRVVGGRAGGIDESNQSLAAQWLVVQEAACRGAHERQLVAQHSEQLRAARALLLHQRRRTQTLQERQRARAFLHVQHSARRTGEQQHRAHVSCEACRLQSSRLFSRRVLNPSTQESPRRGASSWHRHRAHLLVAQVAQQLAQHRHQKCALRRRAALGRLAQQAHEH